MKTMPKPLIVVQTQAQLQDLFQALRISPTFDLEKTTLQIWLRTIGFELAIAPEPMGAFSTEAAAKDLPDPVIINEGGAPDLPAAIDIPQLLYDKLVKARIEQLIDAAFLTAEDLAAKGFTAEDLETLAEIIVGSGLRGKISSTLWPEWLKTKGEKEFEANQGFKAEIIDFPPKP